MEVLYAMLDRTAKGTLSAACNYQRFTLAICLYCLETGGSVTSWIRSERHNATVGGHPRSKHLDGRAVDIVYDVTPPLDARRALAERLTLKLIPESDHDHLQDAMPLAEIP